MRRVKEPHDNPSIRSLMKITDIKVSVVFFNHFSFVSFAEGSFPLVAVFSAPMPIGLSHLPIGANHFVTVTKDLSAAKFAAEIKRNLFKFGLRRFMKERRLPERIQLFCRPF